MQKIKVVFLTLCLAFLSSIALADTKVIMETTLGNVEIELDSEHAPISVANFIDYVNSGYYDGLTFHRIIPNFMIQGGGADENLNFKQTNPAIKNEANNGLKNDRGTIAMARTNVVDSATSQFFINVVNNDALNYQSADNYGYAVFGKVISGMDIVDKIVSQATTRKGPHQNVPVEPIFIISTKIVEQE